MKKACFLLFAAILVAANGYGQKQTVAVVPAEGASVSQDIRIGVTEGLREGVFKSGQYTLVARGKPFEKALSEMNFQQSGAVSDDQLTAFGHALGADFVCYATLSKYSETSYRISYKMINVASGEIVNMDSETVRNGVDGLLTATDDIAKKLFSGGGGASNNANASRPSTSNSDNRRNGDAFNSDGIALVYVEGTEDINGFYIGKYEVTQAQWKSIMDANPSYFKGDNLPVEQVNWNDAQEFIRRLNARTNRNYRLPTDAEWEFAAKGGTISKGYDYGGYNNIVDVAWYNGNSGNRTHPVGTKAPNELGIYDMSGNVWEWCQDWSDSSQQSRVNRGGGWGSGALYCRVYFRGSNTPGDRYSNLGFRVVLSL